MKVRGPRGKRGSRAGLPERPGPGRGTGGKRAPSANVTARAGGACGWRGAAPAETTARRQT
jgi:hypothetical protein